MAGRIHLAREWESFSGFESTRRPPRHDVDSKMKDERRREREREREQKIICDVRLFYMRRSRIRFCNISISMSNHLGCRIFNVFCKLDFDNFSGAHIAARPQGLCLLILSVQATQVLLERARDRASLTLTQRPSSFE